jgi:tetratricopeptide (TPR) repeat protein
MSLFDFFKKKDENEPEKKENSDDLIFKDENENSIYLSDLEGVTGSYDWQIIANEKISNHAIILHQEARQLGGQGKYDEAIAKLKEANQIAPNWAYPVYDLAYTYLLKQDFENALKYYELTDQLEPKGFFTAKTAHWSLKKEEEGIFPKGIYLAYMQIEWQNSEEEKLRIAHTILEKFPNYAPAWKEIAGNAENSNQRLDAIKKGLELNPDLETKGMLLINQALIYDVQGNTESAKKILVELIFNKESTVANIEMAKFILKSIATRN